MNISLNRDLRCICLMTKFLLERYLCTFTDMSVHVLHKFAFPPKRGVRKKVNKTCEMCTYCKVCICQLTQKYITLNPQKMDDMCTQKKPQQVTCVMCNHFEKLHVYLKNIQSEHTDHTHWKSFLHVTLLASWITFVNACEFENSFTVSHENEVSDEKMKPTERSSANSHEDHPCESIPLCETSSSSNDSSLSGKSKKSVLQKFNYVIKRLFNSRL